jgi:hypothetical protein
VQVLCRYPGSIKEEVMELEEKKHKTVTLRWHYISKLNPSIF